MSRVTSPGMRNGFPFVVVKHAEDGEPISLWDGTTFGPFGTPSKSSTEDIRVYGPGTDNPVGMTLLELSELYWRVKAITHSWNLTITFCDGGTSYTGSGSGSRVVQSNGREDLYYTNESILAARHGWNGMTGYGEGPDPANWTGTYKGNPAGQEGLLQFLFTGGSGGYGYDCLKAGDLFYPGISFYHRCGRDGLNFVEVSTRATDPTVELAATFQLLDLPPVPLYGYSLAWPPGAGVTAATGTVSVQPKEYWPYLGTNGALYDGAAGNPISPYAPVADFSTTNNTYWIPLI